MPLVEPRSIVRRVASSVWLVLEPTPIDQWADQHRVVTSGNAEPGPWRTSRTPYLREVMRSCRDPEVSQVTVMMGSQLGKTEGGLNAMYQSVVEQPGTWLMVYPNDRKAAEVLRKRVRKTVQAMPIMRGLFLPGRTQSRSRELNFRNGAAIIVAGSGSSTNVRSDPIPNIIIDEADLCFEENADILQEARQRTGSFLRSKIILLGTPGDAGEGIDAEFNRSDRRRFHVPCPHPQCGRYQELVFRQVKWVGGTAADPTEVEATAYYECEACGMPIRNHHKPEMLRRGVWVREGQSVQVDADGAVRLVGDVRPSSHHGYCLSSLYSPFKTFGWVARDFVEAKGFPGRVWFNGKLAQAWSPRGESVEVETLAKLCLSPTAGGYAMGTIPDDVLALTMSVDVQLDHCWVLVEGWTEEGVDCYTIWAERVESPTGSGLWQLDAVRTRPWPRASTGEAMMISATFIDSGYRTAEVLGHCRDRLGRHVYPVLGKDVLSRPHRASIVDKMPSGAVIAGALYRLEVNNGHWTQAIWGQFQNALRVVRGETIELPPDLARPPGRRFLPGDLPKWALEHLTSEQAITKRKAGQLVVHWTKRPGREDNHLLDCMRYNAAGADWAGVRRLLSRQTISARQQQVPPRTIGGASGGAIDQARERWRG